MGYFDPWVTPVIHPIPPNEVAKYQCPMHDGMQSEKPGFCPLCGMAYHRRAIADATVSQLAGTFLPGVTYRLYASVVTSRGQSLTLWSRVYCPTI